MPRLITVISLFLVAILCGSLFAANTLPTAQSLNKMPLSFTKNMGQWDDRVLFRANSGGATMWFTKEGITYQFTRRIDSGNPNDRRGTLHVPAGTRSVPLQEGLDSRIRGNDIEKDSIDQLVLTAKFLGANPNPEIIADGEMEYKCNYFIGNDPSKWHTDVPNYEAITLKDIYPGIDLKYSEDGNGQAAYEFIASPGADISQIKVTYEGAESTSLGSDGKLILKTKWGEMIAALGSDVSGTRSASPRFDLNSERTLGIAKGSQSISGTKSGTLTLAYSTYLGGDGGGQGIGITVDSSGCAYVTGVASSAFPTLNPYETYQGAGDAFVTKLSNSGSSLIYSTYLGGEHTDAGYGIVVDCSGNAYVTGYTMSSDFPVLNPYQTDQGIIYDYDAFVAKLSRSGDSLIYSTYLGGGHDEVALGIAVDSGGNTGWTQSPNFPTLNPYQTDQGGMDAFVTKLTWTPDYPCGDVNTDEQVNVLDIVFLINYIFVGGPAPQQLSLADVNCSGGTNIADVVIMINYIFRNGPAPCAECE
jgi:hypothetical protein